MYNMAPICAKLKEIKDFSRTNAYMTTIIEKVSESHREQERQEERCCTPF
jgi:hypothetical protein